MCLSLTFIPPSVLLTRPYQSSSTTETNVVTMFNMFRKNPTTPIMNLPNELLAEIASYIPTRHSKSGNVIEVKNLAALAATSRTMCAVTTPFLFKEIATTNERQLHALARVSKDLLTLVQ